MSKIMDSLRNLYNQYIYIRAVKRGKKKFNSLGKCQYWADGEARDKRIHVLANGPSLNETISYISKDDDVFTVNYSLNDERIRDLKPKQHFIIDPHMADDKDYLCYLKKCIDNKVIETLVMSSDIYKEWEKLFSDEGIKIINLQSWHEPYNSKRDKENYKKNYLAPLPQTVVITAIYGAVQNNYKEVYLHGNDFSFLSDISIDKNNHLLSACTHFYGSEAYDYTENLGFHLSGWIKNVLLMLDGYQQVKDYADDMGVKIYNLSEKSMLDIFDKKNVHDL